MLSHLPDQLVNQQTLSQCNISPPERNTDGKNPPKDFGTQISSLIVSYSSVDLKPMSTM